MPLPVQHPAAGAPAVRPHGGLARRGPATPDYAPTDGLGFGRLPDSLLRLLRMRGLIPLSTFAVWVDDPVARRRSDGTHDQQVDAWWATESRLVTCSGRRELAPFRKGRLRPSGSWIVGGTIHDLVPVVPERSAWRYPSGRASGPLGPPAVVTDEPLDLLPAAVTGPVVGGESRCFLQWRSGWAEESVIAHRVVAGRVRLLRGVRTATGREALTGADWVVETVDTPVVRTTTCSPSVTPATTAPCPADGSTAAAHLNTPAIAASGW